MPNQPPFSEDMEKGVLSILLKDPVKSEDTVRTHLPLDAFYIPAHRQIAETALEMLSKREQVDFVTLKDKLRQKAILEDCGGIEGLSHLFSFIGVTGLEHYVRHVRDKWMLRQAIRGLEGLVTQCYDREADWSELKPELDKTLLSLSGREPSKQQTTREMYTEWVNGLEQRFEKINTRGFIFGIPEVDRVLGASVPPEMVLIGAKPGEGKSALAQQGTLATAMKGIHVGMFSMEMVTQQLMDRVFSHMAKISMRKWRDPRFTPQDYQRIHSSAQKFVDLPLVFNCEPRMTIEAIVSQARRWKAQFNTGVIVIDYLQRVRAPKRRNESRYLELAEAAYELKELGKELDVVVVAPVQLNKAGEERESQNIFQEADRSFRLVKYDEEDGDDAKLFLHVAKDRQGQCHLDIPVDMDGEFVTFSHRPREHDEEIRIPSNGHKASTHRALWYDRSESESVIAD